MCCNNFREGREQVVCEDAVPETREGRRPEATTGPTVNIPIEETVGGCFQKRDGRMCCNNFREGREQVVCEDAVPETREGRRPEATTGPTVNIPIEETVGGC